MKPTLLLVALTSSLYDAERPEVTVPRQTSGDTAVDHVARLGNGSPLTTSNVMAEAVTPSHQTNRESDFEAIVNRSHVQVIRA